MSISISPLPTSNPSSFVSAFYVVQCWVPSNECNFALILTSRYKFRQLKVRLLVFCIRIGSIPSRSSCFYSQTYRRIFSLVYDTTVTEDIYQKKEGKPGFQGGLVDNPFVFYFLRSEKVRLLPVYLHTQISTPPTWENFHFAPRVQKVIKVWILENGFASTYHPLPILSRTRNYTILISTPSLPASIWRTLHEKLFRWKSYQKKGKAGEIIKNLLIVIFAKRKKIFNDRVLKRFNFQSL